MRTIQIFSVDVEFFDEGKWYAWASRDVIATNITHAMDKVLKEEQRDNKFRWRASGVRFKGEAIA